MFYCQIVEGELMTTFQIQDNNITIYREDSGSEFSNRPEGYNRKAKVESAGYNTIQIYSEYYEGKEYAPPGTEEIFAGLINKYVHSVNNRRAYLTTKEFVQGIGLLGWKTELKIEIKDNYVTNKPTFINEGKIITFSQFLELLLTQLTEAKPMTE